MHCPFELASSAAQGIVQDMWSHSMYHNNLINNYLDSHNIINVIYDSMLGELLRRLFMCLFVRLIVCSIGCSALFSCALLRFALLPCTRSPPKGTTSPIPRHRSKFTHPTHSTANDPTPHYNFADTQQSNYAWCLNQERLCESVNMLHAHIKQLRCAHGHAHRAAAWWEWPQEGDA